MEGVEQFLETLSFQDEPIVVAVSGGPDSMALLSLLIKNFSNIICVHVNHNTGRSGQNEDEEFVKQYCVEHHLIFESMKIESYEHDNFHNQAHKIRYQFFETILNKYHSKYLFTAHHGDDLIESTLFRLTRGTTIQSISGMVLKKQYKNYWIIRPFLLITKEEILNYNHNNHILYRNDPSNESEIYTRNRIRKQILPFLKSENKKVHLKFLDFSEELKEIETYIYRQVQEEFENRYHHSILSISSWNILDKVIQKRILYQVLSEIYQDKQNLLNKHHVVLLEELIQKQSGSSLILPENIQVQKEYETLIFIKEKMDYSYNFEFTSDLLLPNGHSICFVKEENTDSNFVCRLNKNDIVLPLIVRTRKSQDQMLVKGLSYHKKIKDIFINEKVPIHLRDEWPIVTDQSGKIVWLPGIKKSQFDKTKEEKYDIILRYY